MLPYNLLVQLSSAMNWVVRTTGQLCYGINTLVLEQLGKPRDVASYLLPWPFKYHHFLGHCECEEGWKANKP